MLRFLFLASALNFAIKSVDQMETRCPSCTSTSVRVTPLSRDLFSYQCDACSREWSKHTYNARPEPLNMTTDQKKTWKPSTNLS